MIRESRVIGGPKVLTKAGIGYFHTYVNALPSAGSHSTARITPRGFSEAPGAAAQRHALGRVLTISAGAREATRPRSCSWSRAAAAARRRRGRALDRPVARTTLLRGRATSRGAS